MTDLTDSSPVADELRDLVRNLWWCWDPEATEVLRELSPTLWESTGHDPLAVLRALPAAELEARAADPAWRARLASCTSRLAAYVDAGPNSIPLGRDSQQLSSQNGIAYLCAEFAIHESLPLYSGGLGVLAGDHLKSASDMRLPMVAVGLFYHHGFLTQQITADGDQEAGELFNDPSLMPVTQVLDTDGKPARVTLRIGERDVALGAWCLQVGRVPLYLLDADVEGNHPDDVAITRQLYGGDEEMRIRQELVLGCGGVKMLRAVGVNPGVWHMNEGHAAFSTLERLREWNAKGVAYDEALDRVRATTLFTTHTPVPAGHDRFGYDLTEKYLAQLAPDLGLTYEQLLDLGRASHEDDCFNMTLLALTFAAYCNGVSKLHGIASRQLLAEFWPEMSEEEIPIDSITNGVHLSTWVHPEIRRCLGAYQRPVKGSDFTNGIRAVPPAELWRVRQRTKADLVQVIRTSLGKRPGDADVKTASAGLEGEPLLIGFARRFARYKRADLLISDPERLAEVLGHSDRPVRLLIAGKAHPRDERGKEILKSVVRASRNGPLQGKVLFHENYDMKVARALVQGVDVWLNTPRRMQEASGTSGMKASANGALNLSIADGWWPEAADGTNGWVIGPAVGDEDHAVQDAADATELLRLIREVVAPLYYERDAEGIPQKWLEMVYRNLETVPQAFNTNRMVQDYMDRAYRPLARIDSDDAAKTTPHSS